ncbi:hypothetical protein NXV12_08450 [Bacteroides thetaiotaomicron]|nr:hypothetical protein [Bacteroides thetaiotaomicron]
MSPNCCVIDDSKPHFLTVSKVLKKSADNTLGLLKQELEIKKGEILESLHFASLEKIFIEERIYKDKEFRAIQRHGRRLRTYRRPPDSFLPELYP